jgi:hypothetical protein
MRYQKTNKLFYKKWPFKVECYLRGSSRIKYNGCDQVIAWCQGQYHPRYQWWEENDLVKPLLLEFAQTVKPYLDKDLQIRVEGGRFNIFCKDIDLFHSIIRDFNKWITVVTEPEDDAVYEFLLDDARNKIICDEYPWGGYRFKVIIREKMPLDSRNNFVIWAFRYGGKIRVAGETLRYLQGGKRWMQDPFIYVKDEATLTMVGLYLGNNCKRTHEYILKSSINTPCPQKVYNSNLI